MKNVGEVLGWYWGSGGGIGVVLGRYWEDRGGMDPWIILISILVARHASSVLLWKSTLKPTRAHCSKTTEPRVVIDFVFLETQT